MSTVGLVDIQPDKTQPGPGQYLEPNSPEVIEMRNTINFTRLPQNPPPPTESQYDRGGSVKTDIPMIIAPIANGTSPHRNPSDYPDASVYGPTGHEAEGMTTFGHGPPSQQPTQGVSAPRPPRPRSHYRHTYEELPSHMEQEKVRLEENGQSPYGQHMAHTEVDQAMLFPNNNSSQVHLTSTGSSEKKPRKKLNPIYDGYQGPTKVVSTKGSSKPPQHHQQHHGSPVKQCSSCSVKCLKSPCTTFLVILVVFLMVIAGVLIFMGKITTPATDGIASEISQPEPSTPGPSGQPMQPSLDPGLQPQVLLQMLEEQSDLIRQMQEKINMLENVLGGSESNVNASLSTKVAQNSFTLEQLTQDVTRHQDTIDTLDRRVQDAEGQITTQIGNLLTLTSRTTRLENSTNSLDVRVLQLNAKAETQSVDIRDINSKNTDQDNQIYDVDSKINRVEQEYQFQLGALNRTIYGELDVISKMPGPRGYNGSQGPKGEPGAGNLTLCEYGSRRAGSGFDQTTTVTAWVGPGENVVIQENELLTGLTCSTTGGALANLEWSAGEQAYRCVCSGNSGLDQFGRTCFIHWWKCPKTS